MVTIHLQDYCAYLDIFTKTDVGGFWVKMCKIEHFLYFRKLSMSWCGCSEPYKMDKATICRHGSLFHMGLVVSKN